MLQQDSTLYKCTDAQKSHTVLLSGSFICKHAASVKK